ncbi:6,7-dimethyl-8-ribityllumazine synthase [Maritalea mediterranea]|uniref:6,7-dimethyl-8-ribityllumazine synthase n=1 Tax=Maritalea mediterranea TaxID=2909667 RepID=A0ABS9E8B2_9HYPH|nr:6,7-dimethyl-8-ribityllumazine synthase [Maritalea mediterranea]MCF4099117.1 6,7-dimethyl-8-ribityllumazine synthase [Maritalea mediterranea]
MSEQIKSRGQTTIIDNARVAVVVSQFNPKVTQGLLAGAKLEMADAGLNLANKDIFDAPGAFEMPLIAKKLAKSGRYDGVVCLGCVIKGDTAHFEFISLGATMGIVEASLETEVPICFGILTTYTQEQAVVRSSDDAENKGREAVAACLGSLATLQQITELN